MALEDAGPKRPERMHMSQVTELRSRGIQEADVFTAADALLAEGKRPTIERVRLKIGRGSPNTVSPMLENGSGRWASGW